MSNPNPSRVTDALWWLWLQLHDMEPASELGGIYANKSGYHNTRDANADSNYSVREVEDRKGPGDKSAALDWTFPDAQRGDYTTINRYCGRLMASSRDAHDPRLDDLREWYGQTDHDSHVEGWDCRHLIDITSDTSHLWHIHFSFDRGKVTEFATMRALMSVLRGETVAQWRGSEDYKPTPPKPIPSGPTGVPGARELHRGLQGEDVRFVQRFIGTRRCGPADADFGPRTEAGVRWYQAMRGIEVDGIVGRDPFRQLGVRVTY